MISRLSALFRPAVWRTTAFRLAGFYIAVFCTLMWFGLLYVNWATVGVIERQNRDIVNGEITALSEEYRKGGIIRLIVRIEDRVGPNTRTENVYLLLSPARQPVAGNLNSWPRMATPDDWFTFPIVKSDGTNRVDRQVEARSFALPDGYRLLVGRDSEQRTQFSENFFRAATWVAGITILIGIAAGVFASRRVLRRVDRAALAGEQIAAGNLDSRLPLAGTGDEFDRLASSLNSTLDRIEDLMSGMRIATDSISHDVRRPLTRLRAKLEMSLTNPDDATDGPETMGTAIEEIDKTVLILDNLLKIARAEAGVAGASWQEIDLAAIAEDAVELYLPVAEDRDLTLAMSLTAAPTRAEPQLLAQAVANLIDNAIKYTEPGGQISVSSKVVDQGTAITITDNGPGISVADRDRATDRFVRLDDDGSRATEGSGLGLSLVRAVAHMHGGELVLGDAAPGLTATIYIPDSTAQLS